MKRLITTLVASLLAATQPALSQPGIQQQQVQFKHGETGARLKGRLEGDQTIDHTLTAGAGQTLRIQLAPSNASDCFNLLPPGSDEAIHIGSSASNDFAGALKTGGTHAIRVYLMRNAARRNENTTDTLDVGTSGAVKQP